MPHTLFISPLLYVLESMAQNTCLIFSSKIYYPGWADSCTWRIWKKNCENEFECWCSSWATCMAPGRPGGGYAQWPLLYVMPALNCVHLSLKSDDHYHIMWIWWCVIDMKIQTRFSWLQKFHHIWGKKDSEIFRIGTICSFVFTHLIFSIAKLVYKMIFLDQA